jgi:hypothetical protein
MDMRRVRVGCEFVYVAAVDTPAVFQVEPLDAAPVSLARRGVVDGAGSANPPLRRPLRQPVYAGDAARRAFHAAFRRLGARTR